MQLKNISLVVNVYIFKIQNGFYMDWEYMDWEIKICWNTFRFVALAGY